MTGGIIYTASDGSTWNMRAVCPPIPTKAFDWEYVHDDYGGPGDHRHGNARDMDACVAEIERGIAEGEWEDEE